MTTIPAVVVQELIELGRTGAPGIPPSLAERESASRILICGREPWQELASTRAEPDVRDLIKGLVMYSRTKRLVGGSVSPVIDLYSVYRQRFPELEPLLTAWIVENRVNDYEPFGTTVHHSAKSFGAFQAARADRRQGVKHSEQADQDRKRARLAREATGRLANAVRRGDVKAVKVLLDKGADTLVAAGEGGSLQRLAADTGRAEVLALLQERGVN
jgi:hypothetical protein